ncbi:MAG: metallophosphoesterase family protein [Myxococcota bacterium]
MAVIADVHANRAALEAVLEEIHTLSCDRIVCLGDTVGYHAEPIECVRMVRGAASAGVIGNHDWAAVRDEVQVGTNEHARRVMQWTAEVLPDDCRAYLQALPACHVDDDGIVAAHGCYLNPAFHRGYVTATMLERNLRTVATNPAWPVVALCGHTHIPMCGWLDGEGVTHDNLRAPVTWPAAASAVLVNPGSVGQPRDGDPRASFAVLDLEMRRVEVHRLAYDVEATIDALDRAGFAKELGFRLREGR